MNEISGFQGQPGQQGDGDRVHDGAGPDAARRTGMPCMRRPLRIEGGGTDLLSEDSQESDDDCLVLNFQGNKSMCGTAEDGKCFTLNAMHGHDVHVVCFQQNQREEVRILGEQAGALTAESGMHNTNYLVLNDQGGSVMDVSDKAGCLRAQEHGHPPVVCFEPGITKREGGNSRIIKDRCGTLRAEMGDNQPAVCYAVYPGVSITSANSGSNPQPGDPCPTLVNDSRYYLVGVREDDR